MESILASLNLGKKEEKVKNIIEILFNEFGLNNTIKIGDIRLFIIKDNDEDFKYSKKNDFFFKTCGHTAYFYNLKNDEKDYFRFEYSEDKNLTTKYYDTNVYFNSETDLALIEEYEKYLLNKQLNEELAVKQSKETNKPFKI